MRRLLFPVVLLLLVLVAACAGSSASSDIDKIKPGTSVTVTMKDGTVVAGRFVEGRPDQVVVDPFQGGEWQTLPRAQVASIKQTDAANTSGEPAGEVASAPAAAEPHRDTTGGGKRASGRTSASTPGRALADSSAHAPAPAPRPAFREVTVPADTLLHVRLENSVGSKTSRVEDAVRAATTEAVEVDGIEAVPAGSQVRGVVTEAKPAGKVKGRAAVALRFDTVEANGDRYEVQTQRVAREAASTTKKDAAKIGIPAAGGAIIGGILGGGKGAAIGGAVGGGAGTAVVLGTAGDEVHLPAGTMLTVKLLEPLTVRVPVDR